MTTVQVEKLKKSIKNMVREIKPGSKEAMKMLVNSGIYEKSGKLRKAYR
jgi:transposase